MVKTKIEWCDSSWSPATGCRHGCPYCFARGIANRFGGCDKAPDGHTDQQIVYLTEREKVTTKAGKVLNAAYPYGFTPTFHEYRLDDPLKKGFGKTIFVCSTADLFGDWVPDDWIEKVFDSCKAAPNHRYLFLTKNPDRYLRLGKARKLPDGDNFWYGSTATDPEMKVFFSDYHHTFVSIEPILAPFAMPVTEEEKERFKTSFANTCEWVILGAETGNRKGKVVPRRDWFEGLVDYLKCKGTPVFMKDSIKPIWGDDLITEFPWED